jgi:alpha-N-arabinofuranosidase
VLTLANLAQIVNVLHATVMTQGAAVWVTPTYYVFQLHKPHIGAQALPVHVEQGGSLPDGSSAISATASHNGDQIAVTLVNRHFDQPGQVELSVGNSASQAAGQILAASSPRDMNSADDPQRVTLAALKVQSNGDKLRIDMPPHSVATVQFAL